MRNIAAIPRAHLAVAASVAACLAALAGCGGSSSKTSQPAMSPASGLQAKYVSVVNAVGPSVVQIQTPQALGSGIVFDNRGDIVTNAHVVAGASKFTVTLQRGKQFPATVVGTDTGNDLAVLHMTGATPQAATFADSSKVNVGDITLAIGNPLGLHSSVTEGIVSALGRTVSEGNGVTLTSAIQTSAAINPGNSGGALVDLDGAVIGIPTLDAIDPEYGNAQAPGIGFAIAGNQVKTVAARILSAND
jgi:S1-C subfamily serine protease